MIPAEFKMPNFDQPESWGNWKGVDPRAPGAILRPTAGALGPMKVEFAVVNEFLGEESEQLGIETYRAREVLHIQTDKFSNVPISVGKAGEKKDPAFLEKSIAHILSIDSLSDDDEKIKKQVISNLRRTGVTKGAIRCEMSKKLQMDLAPLYKRFQEQKGSTDTHLNEWQAVTDQERGFLMSVGIYFVEQLYHTPEHQRSNLGPAGSEMWERSERFMKAKERASETDERRAEMAALREEREKQSRRAADLEEQMYKMAEKLAALEANQKKTPGRRPGGFTEKEA